MKRRADQQSTNDDDDLNIITTFLQTQISRNHRNELASDALQHGCTVVYKLLEQHPTYDDLMSAVCHEHTDIVNYILQRGGVDPTLDNCHPLRFASECGYDDIVKLLLKDGRSNPAISDNDCIYQATIGDHRQVVTTLLGDPRVDPYTGITFESVLDSENYDLAKLILDTRMPSREVLLEALDNTKLSRDMCELLQSYVVCLHVD